MSAPGSTTQSNSATLALEPFASIPLDEALLQLLIDEHESITLPRLERLWKYYRNHLAEPNDQGGSSGPPAQRAGLPRRLLDIVQLHRDDRFGREIVIENDIAWRIHTLIDFMFPEAPRILSQAADPQKREQINAILDAVIGANGGIALWHNAALLGSVYGQVDFLLDFDALSSPGLGRGSRNDHDGSTETETLPGLKAGLNTTSPGATPSETSSHFSDLLQHIGSLIQIETIEAPRAIPLLNRHDYRVLDAYILHYEQAVNDVRRRETMLDRIARTLRLSRAVKPKHGASGGASALRGASRATVTVTEIHSATHTQRYEDDQLVFESRNRLGRIPVVHIQNLAQPLRFEGLSDVEPLIPLQDELNTRLCDRANRVTMQSFRMWLGKGIDNFLDRPVGPGQMWLTDNLDASIEAFGGDADSPSERQHLEDLREALDKASGVTPAAAGHIKARVGNLTSENALRISLMGTIAKIKRKRVTYGQGISQLCNLILQALHVHGVYRSEERDRRVEIRWGDAIPADESRRIKDALDKAKLGIPIDTLRSELGYPAASAGEMA